ncbi:MAG: YpdA family putative bacillithiol disulfide reductase [Armatimonadetes bacterium]|nr:YpdA family putative bacillithiol disulfide reductase [Armatimonadota bacterium]
MNAVPEHFPLVIVGAGPAGLATALAAREAGLEHVVLERGAVAENIRRFPANLVFYSTPDLVELGDIPLICAGAKPTRTEAVTYYTRFAGARELNVRTYEEVVLAERLEPGFRLLTRSHVGEEREYRADHVVLAFGAYDQPNRLDVPGEDLPHVSHWFDEPERYHGRSLLIVGGKGSAAEAALLCWRAGARVTISYRQPRFTGLKYWIEPDLVNRIAEGSITAYLPSHVVAIGPRTTRLRLGDGSELEVAADFVLALTGYQPKLDLFDQLGVRYDPLTKRAVLDPETHQSCTPGVYVAGCICAGNIGNEIFIENGRLHGAAIVAAVIRER